LGPSGLRRHCPPGRSTYIDKSDAARRKPPTAALVAITAETDRVYLDTPGRCAIEPAATDNQ
jgi:hypothetical protein